MYWGVIYTVVHRSTIYIDVHSGLIVYNGDKESKDNEDVGSVVFDVNS